MFRQPGNLDYRDEGGPTDSCSAEMSNGRGPFRLKKLKKRRRRLKETKRWGNSTLLVFLRRSTKNFQKKYGLELTAATFLIVDYSDASMEIACQWQQVRKYQWKRRVKLLFLE